MLRLLTLLKREFILSPSIIMGRGKRYYDVSFITKLKRVIKDLKENKKMKFRQVDNSTMVNLEKVEFIVKRFEFERYYIAYILPNNAETHEYFETAEERDATFAFLCKTLQNKMTAEEK